MKQLINQLLKFNAKERRGLLTLALLIIILLVIRLSEDYWVQSSESFDFTAIKKDAIAYEHKHAKSDNQSYNYQKQENSFDDEEKVQTKHFTFNPNTASSEELASLGLSAKQIKVLKNFREKGGHFYKKEDLLKVYGMTKKLYADLEPYIVTADEPQSNAKKENADNTVVKAEKQPYIKKIEPVDINYADTTEIISLPAIGSAFAKRIEKYRDALGGFINAEQLLEVYGIDTSKFEKFKEYIYINQTGIKPININKCTIGQLKSHPYLNFNIARSIVMRRERHGAYKNVDEIKKSDLITDELYSKIAPYLSID